MKRTVIFLCLLSLVGCDPIWMILVPDAPYEWVSAGGKNTAIGHLEERGVSLDFTGQLTYFGTLSITGGFDVRITNSNEYPLKISDKNVLLKIDENPEFQLVPLPRLYKSKDPGLPLFSNRRLKDDFIAFKETVIEPKETILIFFHESIPSVPKESLSIIFDDLYDRKNSDRVRLSIRFLM